MTDIAAPCQKKNETHALRIALIGCGKMGRAMLRGWLAAGIADKVHILDPHPLPAEFSDYVPNPLYYYDSIQSFTETAPDVDIYVMAVKPQIMDEVCTALVPAVYKDRLVLSIAAGQDIAAFKRRFGNTQPVIRAMPNTPAAIGKGISVAVASPDVSEAQKNMADTLLTAVGKVEFIKDESLLDAVTAVSGSGPAYVFHLIEAMASAGEKAGLPARLAMSLARETIIGAAALAEAESQSPAATLRENVTSPGGTTAAALEVLRGSGALEELMSRAIAAATERSRALSQ